MNAARWLCSASLFLCAACAYPQDKNTAEEVAVVEIGAAPSRNLTDRTSSFGPTVAVEFTPVEKWLEVEAGVTPSFGHRTTEWATDLIFKKPWTLSPTVEFMAGVGPEWIHTRESGASTNSVAGEAALDFMFWPKAWKRKFGWYLEPAYEYNFGRGHEKSIGISFGVLIAIRKH
ncbi:MAG TPA: hypothetical protein VN736_03180 [Candidatus Limnocylindrales bacterium]|nr:hypothetical protein [Candidatus Limnocylindrales bacterium]